MRYDYMNCEKEFINAVKYTPRTFRKWQDRNIQACTHTKTPAIFFFLGVDHIC